MAVIVMTSGSRYSTYLSIVATIRALIVGCEAKGPRGVIQRLIVLDAELCIASRGRALETHSIVVQVSKINIEAGTISSVPVTRVMLSAWLPRIAAV